MTAVKVGDRVRSITDRYAGSITSLDGDSVWVHLSVGIHNGSFDIRVPLASFRIGSWSLVAEGA